MANKAYIFRLNPSTYQIELLKQHGGSARWLWNYMLDHNKSQYKQTGKFVFQVDIDRFTPSTKMCGSCGMLNDTLTLKDREWKCDCGVQHDRDINAANNIRSFGLTELNRLGTSRIYACGETNDGNMAYDIFSYVSSKQENLVIGPETADSLDRR